MMSQSGVKVCIRARPLIQREAGLETFWDVDTHQVRYKNSKDKVKSYTFDRVFSDDEVTSDVYEEIVEPIVQSAMQGFNGTIFAYGQTASGKTYTMLGSPESSGVIPLAIDEIFSIIERTPEREFLLRMSYLEIYNENLKDLLAEENTALTIREDEFKNVKVSGLVEKMVTSPNDVQRYMAKGEKIRHMGSTNMNDRSSRSHTICKVVIESRERIDANRSTSRDGIESAVKVAQLNLVDLAGSERASQTGAEGQRFKEGCYINKSLMVLGQVINQICKDNEVGGGSVFISFRDSKLTRILQPSLGGNSLTAIICTVTLAAVDETESTLRFASSAKNVKNKPIINEVLSDEALLFKQKREINKLRKQIEEMEKQQEQNDIKIEYEEKIQALTRMLLVSSHPVDYVKKQQKLRRETWCPGAMSAKLRNTPAKENESESCEPEFSSIDRSVFFHDLFTEERSRLESGTPLSHAPKHRMQDTGTISAPKRPRFDETPSFSKDLLTEQLSSVQEQLKMKEKLLTEQQVLVSEYKATVDSLEMELSASKEELRSNQPEQLQAQIRKLTGEIKMQDSLIQQFISEQNNEASDKEALTLKIDELTNKVVELERREISRIEGDSISSALQGRVNDLSEQLRETCREKRLLQEQFDAETDRSTDLSSTVKKLTDSMSSIKEKSANEVEEYKHKMLSLQSQLEASLPSTESSMSLEKRDNEIASLKEQLTEKDDMISELQRSISCLQTKVSELESESAERLHGHDATLKEDESANSVRTETSMKEIDGTQCLEEALKHCELLMAEKETIKKEMDEMVFKLLEKEGDVKKMMEQAKFDHDEKEILFEEEKRLVAEVEKLKDVIEKIQNENLEAKQRHDGELRQIKDQLVSHDQKRVMETLQQDAAIYQKTAKDAEVLLHDSNRDLSQAQSEVNELKKTVEKQKAVIIKLEADVESYMWLNEADTGKSSKHHLERSIDHVVESPQVEAEACCDDLNGKIKELEELLAKSQQDLTEKENSLKSLEEHKEVLTEDITLCRLQNKTLTCDLDKCKADNQVLTSRITKWESDHESTTEMLKMNLQSANEQLEDLHQKINVQCEKFNISCQASEETTKEENADKDLLIIQYEKEVELLNERLREEQASSQELQASLDCAKNEKKENTPQSSDNEHLQTEQLLENLAAARKEIAEMQAANEHLKEDMLHVQGALLAENNKELDQQRLLEKADQDKKDSTEVFAQERELANNEIKKLNRMLEEKQTALAKSLSEKDIALHHTNKLQQQYDEAVAQVNELQSSLDGKHQSTMLSLQIHSDSQKLEKKIKQLSLNLDLTQQKLAKAEQTNKQLQGEIKEFESERMKSLDLFSSSQSLKADVKLKQVEVEELKVKLKRQEIWIQEQTEDFEKKKELLEAKIPKVDLKEQLDELQEEVDVLKLEKGRKIKEVSKLQEDLAKHEEDFQVLTGKSVEMQTQLEGSSDEVASLTLTINQRELEIADKQKAIEKLSDENSSLEQRLKLLSEQLDEAQLDANGSKAVIDSLKIKISDFEAVLTDDKAEQLKLLEEQQHLSDVEKNFVLLYHNFSQLSEKYEILKENATALSMPRHEEDVAETTEVTDQNTTEHEVPEAAHQTVALERELEEPQAVPPACDENANTTDVDFQNANGKPEEIDERIENIQRQLEKAQVAFTEVAAEKETLLAENHKLNIELQSHNQNLEELSSRGEKVCEACEHWDAKFQQAVDKNTALEDELAQVVAKLEEKTKTIQILQENCAKFETEMLELQNIKTEENSKLKMEEVAQISAQLAELKANYSKQCEENEELTKELKMNCDKILLLEAECQQTDEERSDCKNEISRLRQEFADDRMTKEKELEKQLKLIAEKEEKIQTLERLVGEEKNRIKEFDADLAKAIEDSKADIAHQTQQNAKIYQEALQEAASSASCQQKRVDELESLLASYQDKMKGDEEKIQHLEKSASVTSENVHLGETCDQLKEELQLTLNKIRCLEAELGKVRQENRETFEAKEAKEHELAAWMQRAGNRQERILELEDLVRKDEEESKMLNEKIQDLEKAVQEKPLDSDPNESNEKLKEKLKVYTQHIKSFQASIKKLRQENHDLSSTMETKQKELDLWMERSKNRRERVLELEHLVREDEEESKILNKKIQDLEKAAQEKSENSHFDGTCDRSEEKLAVAQNKIQCLEADLKRFSQENKVLAAKKSKQEELALWIQRAENRQERILELEGLVREDEEESKMLNEKIKKLESDLGAKSHDSDPNEPNEKLKEKLKVYTQHIKSFQASIKKLRQENHDLSSTMASKQKELDLWMGRAKNRQERILELEGLVREDEEESKMLNEKIKKLEKDLEQKVQAMGDDERKEKVAKLEETLNSTRQDYEKKISSLTEQLKANEGRMYRIKEQLRIQVAQHNDSISQFSSDVAQRSSSVGRYGGFVEKTKFELQELEMIKIQQQNKYLEKELAKYMDIEDKRKAENQMLLDKCNKMRHYMRGSGSADSRPALVEKSQNVQPPIQDEVSKQQQTSNEEPEAVDTCKTQ